MSWERGKGGPQGGMVRGMRKIDMRGASGEAIEVANASFDPGYPLDETLDDAGTKIEEADLEQGYCTYGKAIGEGRK